MDGLQAVDRPNGPNRSDWGKADIEVWHAGVIQGKRCLNRTLTTGRWIAFSSCVPRTKGDNAQTLSSEGIDCQSHLFPANRAAVSLFLDNHQSA